MERRGVRGVLPDTIPLESDYKEALELWCNRNRFFPTTKEGMNATLCLAKEIVSKIGEGSGSCVFLEGERIYWQSRNKAGQLQKQRQDVLGLGWANHDHHTFRSSRPAFPVLIEILKTFGFKKRERFYAGAEAGWGAQVMEQPEAGYVIFADVDLSQTDSRVDFSSQALPELEKPGTVGLWCALHGDSMLQAGMHHLEAQFDFDHLRDSLKVKDINTMTPFSDFHYLRQAFTQGEIWNVDEKRLNTLMAANQISKEGFEKIKKDGAVGSHLENLQRRNGFKGFNQQAVSDIIREVNPEKQALKRFQ